MARPALAHISDVGKGNIEEDIEDIDKVCSSKKNSIYVLDVLFNLTFADALDEYRRHRAWFEVEH